MKYLRLFSVENEFNDFLNSEEYVEPYVCLIGSENDGYNIRYSSEIIISEIRIYIEGYTFNCYSNSTWSDLASMYPSNAMSVGIEIDDNSLFFTAATDRVGTITLNGVAVLPTDTVISEAQYTTEAISSGGGGGRPEPGEPEPFNLR
jgi:hypothetical protein